MGGVPSVYLLSRYRLTRSRMSALPAGVLSQHFRHFPSWWPRWGSPQHEHGSGSQAMPWRWRARVRWARMVEELGIRHQNEKVREIRTSFVGFESHAVTAGWAAMKKPRTGRGWAGVVDQINCSRSNGASQPLRGTVTSRTCPACWSQTLKLALVVPLPQKSGVRLSQISSSTLLAHAVAPSCCSCSTVRHSSTPSALRTVKPTILLPISSVYTSLSAVAMFSAAPRLPSGALDPCDLSVTCSAAGGGRLRVPIIAFLRIYRRSH